jgi:hypothetical protein
MVVQEIRKGAFPNQKGGVASAVPACCLGQRQADLREKDKTAVFGRDRNIGLLCLNMGPLTPA